MGCLNVIDGVEAAFYAIGAAVVLVCLVLLGVRSAHRIVGLVGSISAVAATALVLGIVVRDVLRRSSSAVSIAAACSYAGCFGYLLLMEWRHIVAP